MEKIEWKGLDYYQMYFLKRSIVYYNGKNTGFGARRSMTGINKLVILLPPY